MIHIVFEILEALRGKTIVDSIRLNYKSPVLDSEISRLDKIATSKIKIRNGYLDLQFQQNFLTYVQWPYFSAVEQAQKIVDTTEYLVIYAHQLFEDKNNNFALIFRKKSILFQNRKNIEDTLFLDLQRYCEQNSINYEVN